MNDTKKVSLAAKTKAIIFSILWMFILLIFPVSSGVLATVLKLKQSMIFCLQGVFMLAAAIIPIVYIKIRKQKYFDYGFRKTEKASAKRVLFFIPLVLIVLPTFAVGIDVQSAEHLFSLLFFTVSVAIAEEIYFRGIIYKTLQNAFASIVAIIMLTSLIFGIGHGASIIGTSDVIATILQISNAFFFGIVAIQTVILTKSIYPVMLLHFVYNLGNYLTVASGTMQIVCITIQVAITIITALLFGFQIKKNASQLQINGGSMKKRIAITTGASDGQDSEFV